MEFADLSVGLRVRSGSRTGVVKSVELDSNGHVSVLADSADGDGETYWANIAPDALEPDDAIQLKMTAAGVFTSDPAVPGAWQWRIARNKRPGEDFRRVTDI